MYKLDKIIAVRNNKTVFWDKTANVVIKVFDEDFSKADILNEALNQARIEETNLKVPKILEVEKINGKWSIILEYISGKTIERLLQEQPQQTDELLLRFVKLQIHVYEQKPPMLNHLRDKMFNKINQTDLDATTRYDLQSRLEAMPRENKVCHGDFNFSNVIITPQDEAYIIDWAHVTQGNSSADVARTYLLFNLKGQKELGEKYLDLYYELSKVKKGIVQRWLPIVAASQSIKGLTEEREMLLKWVTVFDYE
ncbi:MAG: aminoglycoside phosphotransferase family protein [Sphaerochaetaceae bacterium]|nr:aminoglycoside phosphotransferase family protein [Sphaerochaetaceae bacterium]